ncbi:diamine N-acetyltransferase [Flavobacteriaceae bacterium UJ101]|nr:diamine N-acetyltransferase [Flavobacteriaceae bacterium UJ101]
MTLISKNIELRALEPEDISILYEWENQTNYWLDSQTLHPYSKHLLNQYLENVSRDIFEMKQLRFVIVLKEKNEAIGFVDLFDLDVKNSRAAIGILIGESQNKNKGYASEAIQLIVDYAFKILNLNQLYADVIESNTISKRLFEKNGFIKTMVKKNWVQLNRQFLDVSLYQLFNNDEM